MTYNSTTYSPFCSAKSLNYLRNNVIEPAASFLCSHVSAQGPLKLCQTCWPNPILDYHHFSAVHDLQLTSVS